MLRTVSRAALDRYCARVLDECIAVVRGDQGTAHDRYLRLFALLRERDDDLARAFDDLRRSTAMPRLAAMMNLGVVSPEELGQFSAPTRQSAVRLAEIFRPRESRRRPRR
jgi:hypothetical protein